MTLEQIDKECKRLEKVSKKLLSLTPTKNPMDIAHALGVNISYIEANKDTPGFIFKGDCFDTSTIYINNKLDNYSKKIICAHELGHLFSDELLDNDVSLFDESIDSDSEFLANYMVYCLMPRVFVFAALERYETVHDFNAYVSSCIHFKNS